MILNIVFFHTKWDGWKKSIDLKKNTGGLTCASVKKICEVVKQFRFAQIIHANQVKDGSFHTPYRAATRRCRFVSGVS